MKITSRTRDTYNDEILFVILVEGSIRRSPSQILSNPVYCLGLISTIFLFIEWKTIFEKGFEVGTDFSIYYQAAQSYKVAPASLYESAGPGLDQYLYPPPSIAIFLTLTAFRVEDAYIVFGFFMYLCLIFAGYLWIRQLEGIGFPQERKRTLAILVFLVAYAPAYHNITLGQINCLVLLLSIGFLHQMREKPILAGGFLAAAIWIKVYPILLLFLAVLTKEGRRCIVYCAIFGLVIPVLLIGVIPINLYFAFAEKLIEISGYASAHIINQSLTAFLLRFDIPTEATFTWPNMYVIPASIKLINTAGLLLTIGLTLYIVWKKRPISNQGELLVGAILLALSAIFSPLGWGHAYILAAPMLLIAVFRMESLQVNRYLLFSLIFLVGILHLIPVYNRLSILQSMPAIVNNVYYSRFLILNLMIIVFALGKEWKGEAVSERRLDQ